MPHSSDPNTCIIWPRVPAERYAFNGNPFVKRVMFSERAGTDYIIRRDVELNLNHELKTDKERARLTTHLLNANLRGDPEPEVTFDMIKLAKNASPLRPDERAERLLRHIVETNPDVAVHATLIRDLVDPQASRFPLSYSALAWSESTTIDEVEFLLDYLRKREYVTIEKNNEVSRVTVTVQGHAHIADRLAHTNSSQAFVAMWFDDTMDAVYHHAIAPAIQAAGYEPYRIDRDNLLNKIDDEIIAQIRQSKFLLADFTHAPEGSVRGSVYYEAGFAYGLGTPCVFTARNDAHLHFDTRQFPHILWKPNALNALKHELTYRIRALPELGPGPKAPPIP